MSKTIYVSLIWIIILLLPTLASAQDSTCDADTFARECTLGCPYGYKNGPDSCPLCECQEMRAEQLADGCPEVLMCEEKCETYLPDDRGCLSCRCGAPDEVAQLDRPASCDVLAFESLCATGCPGGYAKDANGCQICKCAENKYAARANCDEALECQQKCDDYLLDENGCLTCNCSHATEMVFEAAVNCLDIEMEQCDIGCPYGYDKNQQGCPVCQCRQSPENYEFSCDSNISCATRCKDYKPDTDGCLTCECSG